MMTDIVHNRKYQWFVSILCLKFEKISKDFKASLQRKTVPGTPSF